MSSPRSHTALVLLAAFLGGCLTTHLARPPVAQAAERPFSAQRWQYKKAVILNEGEVDELGAQGWEIAACPSSVCYLKRAL